MNELILVYNVDSGLFNALADMAHKIFSPQTYACNLCALTYGSLGEKKAWRKFIDDLPVTATFFHRDEFLQRFPGDATDLPAIFYHAGQERKLLVSAEELSACRTLGALQEMVQKRVTATGFWNS